MFFTSSTPTPRLPRFNDVEPSNIQPLSVTKVISIFTSNGASNKGKSVFSITPTTQGESVFAGGGGAIDAPTPTGVN